MKTAEEYWNGFAEAAGWCGCDYLTDKQKKEFTNLVAAIRADALAEKPAAPDADEERAKREYERLQSLIPDAFLRQDYESRNPASKAGWKAYVKTLPPRPMRSPGQVLNDGVRDALKAAGYDSSYFRSNFHTELPEWKAGMEAAATALGIQPQE